MCGIFGFWNPTKEKFSSLQSSIPLVDRAMAHRGPDAAGYWVSPEDGLSLGHRRLSIIDLSSTGNQPMVSVDGRFRITFNGEIYNYLDLKKELSSRGCIFKGTSDTEVLLAAIVEWGFETTLSKLNGMFAFALWDSHSKKIFLARDPIGEKPLYYSVLGGSLYFSSEIRGIEALVEGLEIDSESLQLYFELSYVPHPYSIYKNVSKLSPGHWIEISKSSVSNASLKQEPFFHSARLWEERTENKSNEDWVNELEVLLEDSIRIRTISDRPIGAFLSGGIDSSLIVSLLQKNSSSRVKTFSIGFDSPEFDEAPAARKIASHLKTDHEEYYVTQKDCLALIPELPRLLDEPLADSSFIPTYLLSQLARKKVVVSLSGDGGDEVFGGYPRYHRALKILSLLKNIPFRRALGPLVLSSAFSNSKKINAFKLAAYFFSESEKGPYPELVKYWQDPRNPLLRVIRNKKNPVDALWNGLSGRSLFQSMLHTDQMTFLPEQILAKLDRASMAVGLETRIPLLDLRIIKFSYRIPFHAAQPPKWILRELLRRYLPLDLMSSRKQGFSPPIKKWLQGELKDWASSYLAPQRLNSIGLFNVSTIEKSWNSLSSQGNHVANDLWNLLVFLAWFDSRKERVHSLKIAS